jgi:hypothetical protein
MSVATPSEEPAVDRHVAKNPLTNGIKSRISIYFTIVMGAIFVVFLILDTVQYVATGHESVLFTAIIRVITAVFTSSLISTLLASYIHKAK